MIGLSEGSVKEGVVEKGCSNIQCFISLIDKSSLKKGNFIIFSVIVKFYTVYKGEKEIHFFYSTLRVNSLGMKAC